LRVVAGSGPVLLVFSPYRRPRMLYYFGMVMAVLGASALIGALTYVSLLITVLIMSMFAFTAAPILDKIFKE
jgi:hypothetical protein